MKMRRPLDRTLAAGLTALLAVTGMAMVGPAAPAGAAHEVVIDFDEAAAPAAFVDATPLRDEYDHLGVTFAGPNDDDGGAVLDEDSAFSVSGHSSPNFLALNVNSTMSNGGTPQGPQTMLFAPPISALSMYAASPQAGSATLDAFDGDDTLVESSTMDLTDTGVTLSVSGPGIERAVLSFTTDWLVVDDIGFTPPTPPSDCSDVPRNVYFTTAFDWAWDTGVTTGVGGTNRCEPLRDVTRAEAVTILWRSMGSPQVATPHPFTDTVPGAYYQPALRWAAAEGHTTGIGGTEANPSSTFGPDLVADRAEQFTFVWRVVGKPGAPQHPFVDVVAGSFYHPAVNWAADTGATTGYAGSNRFEPHILVDRAQMFTIAFRVFS